MKIRDISLMATGAIISVALIALTFTLFNPPKAQAQVAASGAGTPGAGAMIVTTSEDTASSAGTNGVIAINDSATKKVTVVFYNSNGPPTLSTPVSFTYQ